MVNTILFRVDLIRFRKDFSVCSSLSASTVEIQSMTHENIEVDVVCSATNDKYGKEVNIYKL